MKTVDLVTVEMTSREIAELTGKRHDNVVRDIDEMLAQLTDDSHPSKLRSEIKGVKTGTYKNNRGREYAMYTLDKNMTMTLITGYSAKLRLSVIQRLEECEKAIDRIAESTTHEEAVYIANMAQAARKHLLDHHQEVSQAIQDNVETLGLPPRWAHSTIHNMAVKATLGESATAVRNRTGMRPRDFLVSNNDAKSLIDLNSNMVAIEILAKMGKGYHEIKDYITQ